MHAFMIAFAMYSKIPMPKADWTKKNMRYALCYFPFVGIVVGLLFTAASIFFHYFEWSRGLRSVMLTLIPLLVTGGIHLDGYIDTLDALHSYQEREKKLEILKDPHIGAFSVIWTVAYFFAYFGFIYELSGKAILVVAIGFVYSRTLSGLAAVVFQPAKKDGLLYQFSSGAVTRHVKLILFLEMVLCLLAMIWIDIAVGLAVALTGGIVFYLYRRMAYREFGGVTGDLAGYFLQRCELYLLIVSVVVDHMVTYFK